MALTRRSFLGGLVAVAASVALPSPTKLGRWVPKPLPPPAPQQAGDFVRVVVPMCYYSHTRRVTLVSNMVETVHGPYSKADAELADRLAKSIVFDTFS